MRYFITVVLAIVTYTCLAQPTQKCRYSLANGAVLNYAFTENRHIKDSFLYKTTYYIFDNNNLPFKAITVVNHILQQKISIVVNELKEGLPEKNYSTSYNRFSGLVLNNEGDTISALATSYNYLYLLSFDSPDKKFMNLHFIDVPGNYTIQLSVVTDSVLKANNDFLMQASYYKSYLRQQAHKEAERQQKAKEVDSLVNLKVKEIQNQSKFAQYVNEDTLLNKVLIAAEKYTENYVKDSTALAGLEAEVYARIKKFSFNPAAGKYDVGANDIFYGPNAISRNGEGLLVVENRLIYAGQFANGRFVSGLVILRYKNNKVYSGNFAYGAPKGMGAWKLPQGQLELGEFEEHQLVRGCVRRIESAGAIYTGEISNGLKNGFGVFTSSNGNFYVGVFQADFLEYGYSVQVDDQGLKSYSEIINGVKIPILKETWERIRVLLVNL